MAVIQTLGAQDTLVRTSSNIVGWGLLDDGINQYAQTIGFGIDVLSLTSYTVAAPDANKGRVTGTNTATGFQQIGSGTTANINFLERFRISNNSAQAGCIWRYVNTTNYYRTVIFNGALYIQKVVAGTLSTIASASLTGWTSSQYWWVRTVMSGTSITATAWQDGTVEPGTPTISTSDSTFASAGVFGLHTYDVAGGTVYFDCLYVTDNASTTLAWDTFARTLLNTASDGINKWHHWRGDPTGIAILSNKLVITAVNFDYYDLICGFHCWTNGTVKMRGSLSNIADVWGVRARWQSDSFYYAGLYNNNAVSIYLVNNGVYTLLSSAAFICPANTAMWLELDCIGSTFNLYAWLDGGSKPVNPTVSATDTAYLGGYQTAWSPYGNFGLYYNPANTGHVGTFDQFSSTSLDAAYNSVDSPYGQGLYGGNNTTRTNNFVSVDLGGTDDLPLMSNVGVSGLWYRYVVNWGYLEPAQGLLLWDALDDAIAKGNAAGINVYTGLIGTPTWAEYTPGDYSSTPLFDVTKATAFATALAQRYDGNHGHGTMLAIECANEEYSFLATGGTYAALLAAALYPAIKAVNPSILVGSASNTQGTPFYGFISSWMDNWYANGGKGNVDFFNMHPYPDQFNTPFYTIGSNGQSLPMMLQQMDAIMTVNQDVTPIWITELGWPPANFNGFSSGYLPMPQTNIQLLASLDYIRTNSRRFTHYFWYSLGDWYNGVGANLQTPYYTWKDYINAYPSWQWIAGSVYYGSFNLNNNPGGYYVTSRQLGTIQIQEALTPLARYEGDKKSGQYIGSRKIRLSIKVVGTSRPDLEAKLDAMYLALKKAQQRLNIHTGDGRYYIADAIYAPADTGIGNVLAVTVPVDFVCQQPYSYAFSNSAFGVSPQLLAANPSSPNYILNFTVDLSNATEFCRPTIVVTNKRVTVAVALTAGLTNGVVFNSLFVGALNAPLYIGDTLTLSSGANSQTLIVSANAAIGDTSVSVQSFTANFSYPTNSAVVLDIHWNTIALQQWLDNQYWNVLAGNHAGVNGDAMVFTADPVQGISVIDTASPSTAVDFLGTPVTLNPGRNDVSLLISSPSVPLASIAVFYTQRYQN